jgi:hypothetical protein
LEASRSSKRTDSVRTDSLKVAVTLVRVDALPAPGAGDRPTTDGAVLSASLVLNSTSTQ